MKILYGRIGHETNRLSSEMSDFERWARPGWFTGDDINKNLYGKTDYVSGMLKAAEEDNIDLVPTVWIWDAGPLLYRETYDGVLNQLLDTLEKVKNDIDGIYLAIHGAGSCEGVDILETYTLEKVRAIVGSEMPIAITLDLHANLTKSTVALAQGVFGIKEYPHTDTFEAGYLAMKSLEAHINGEFKMYSAVEELPILYPSSIGFTGNGIAKGFKDYVVGYGKEHDLLDTSLMHGFPYSNTPHTGMSVIAVSKRSQEEADAAAKEMAEYIWSRRRVMEEYVPLGAVESMDKAEEILADHPDGYVVINESSDNPGGGTTSDGTNLLREMLKRNIPGSVFGYIADHEMTQKAFAVGVGGRVSGLLGAEHDKVYSSPIEITDAEVTCLSDGKISFNNPMVWHQLADYNGAACLKIGNVRVVVTDKVNQQTYDNTTFNVVGIDLEQARIVGLKSAIHFHAWWDKHAITNVVADTPGICSGDLFSLKLDRVDRPAYPLDKDTQFSVSE